MARAGDREGKALLTRRVADYVLDHGLADLSLRPLARALDTSTRMLLYHFGSKEQLVVAALDEARERLRELLDAWLAEQPDLTAAQLVDRFWRWLCAPEQEPFNRLFFEVYALSLQDPARFPDYAERTMREWLGTFGAVLARAGDGRAGPGADAATDLATVLVAGHRGLLLDLLATGDRGRVDRAQSVLMAALCARDPALRGLASA